MYDRHSDVWVAGNQNDSPGLAQRAAYQGTLKARAHENPNQVRLSVPQLGGDKKYGDYIIGLQIPFTSTINDNSSLFYMPTGAFKSVDDKTADNANPVGTEFTPYNGEYTGIKGAIADATFVQLGGEPIYSFTINFVPIDWII